MTQIRIGVDLGGTKIEAAALDESGQVVARKRIATPRDDYPGTLEAIAQLIGYIESELGCQGSIGIGMPGSFSPSSGLVRNANSTWLNQQPFDQDLQNHLQRPVRFANDANCLALSEAIDGAGAGCEVVFAIIAGTGVGGGLAINGKVHNGANGLGGEWGHNPLPWLETHEYPGPICYCGKHGCIETFVSGTGFANDYHRHTGKQLSAEEILAAMDDGEAEAREAFNRFQHRLSKAIAGIANSIDPDVIVLGGGMSNVTRLYDRLPELVRQSIFGGEFKTPIRPAKHGDSSGVRGAAWLW
ncbi:fructokinase [Halioxenophilus sp. WMMB6]|uniref:fructokinase n=1 Tax=Halioxenophilus sp. WMMB6 TaxID=3073815 RepID=UPI00295F4793|nr:fructokinase [Halioxenophilus sp. WMMB6]